MPSEDLELPGGVEGLRRVLGIEARLPRGRALLEVIRLVYARPDTARGKEEPRSIRLQRYFTALGQLEDAVRAARSAGDSISLKLAQTESGRKRLQGVLDVIGLRVRPQRQGYAIERTRDAAAEERRELLAAAGVDSDLIERALASGEPITPAVASDSVPQPLPAAVWSAAVFKRSLAGSSLASAILSDRNAALLYHGLAALDQSTLDFLDGSHDLLAWLYGQRAAVFATCGRSLHLRGDRVVTPGPEFATVLWEALVGERVDRPGAFISRLLGNDEGRLALFYDTVAHLDAPGQRYALGATIGSDDMRTAHLRALYLATAAEIKLRRPADRPFYRLPFDAAQRLSAVAVTEDGQLKGPSWSRFWTAVLETGETSVESGGPVRSGELGEPLSAAALVALTGGPDPITRSERSETILFAQRVFGAAPAAAASDMLVALRGFTRFRALMLSLERMGVTDPGLMARAARHAERLSGFSDPAVAGVLLAQFQGALAIVERARSTRVLTVGAAGELVGALLAFEPVLPAHHARQMARWIDARLLPTLRQATGATESGGSRERIVLMAMAGTGAPPGGETSAAGGTVVRWEDHDYRVDLAGPELTRLERLRARQPSNRLDEALEFARAAETLIAGARQVADLPAACEGLRVAATHLRPPAAVGLGAGKTHPDPKRVVDRILQEAAAIQNDREVASLAGLGASLFAEVGAVLAEVLATLAYLPSLGDPAGPALLAGNVAALHEFGFDTANIRLRGRLPWNVATEQSGAGESWHVEGSLLGLDVALAPLALRAVATERIPQRPAFDIYDRAAMAATVVLTNPRDLNEADAGLIVGAIKRGRRRVEEGLPDPVRLAGWLADAGADEWRIRAIEWMAGREPDEARGMLSLVDLFWLGASGTGRPARLDAFGLGPATPGACLCTSFPPPRAWDTVIGREGAGFLASRFGDLKLRLLEGLADFQLPAVLLPALLAVATPDFTSEATPVHRDDWVTAARQAQAIPKGRLEDYVASLTASGPLVPAASGRRPPSRP